MLEIRALMVDFDGTACSVDVSEVLLARFGDPAWIELDEALDRGEMGLREAGGRQAAMLRASPEEMVAYAVDHCPLDPTFASFVAWARERALPLVIASDGFAFYVHPILEAGGVQGVEVVTNELSFGDGAPELRHPNGHPACVGCGTCKMLVAQSLRERHGPVAFVGEGVSDRYAALYSDVVFAKDALPDICARDSVPFLPWDDFDDVRAALERASELPGALDPEVCPGWTPAAAT